MLRDVSPGVRALLQAADRDLNDAQTSAVSLDRRFAIACLAFRHLAAAVRTAAGAQGPAPGGHRPTGLEVLAAAIGPDAGARIRYLERCRARCDRIDRAPGSTTELDVEELIGELVTVRGEVRRWLSAAQEERTRVHAPRERTGPSEVTCPVAISMARVPQDTS